MQHGPVSGVRGANLSILRLDKVSTQEFGGDVHIGLVQPLLYQLLLLCCYCGAMDGTQGLNICKAAYVCPPRHTLCPPPSVFSGPVISQWHLKMEQRADIAALVVLGTKLRTLPHLKHSSLPPDVTPPNIFIETTQAFWSNIIRIQHLATLNQCFSTFSQPYFLSRTPLPTNPMNSCHLAFPWSTLGTHRGSLSSGLGYTALNLFTSSPSIQSTPITCFSSTICFSGGDPPLPFQYQSSACYFASLIHVFVIFHPPGPTAFHVVGDCVFSFSVVAGIVVRLSAPFLPTSI